MWTIELAARADAEEILKLQKLAYQSEAAIYNDATIAPLTQTMESITADFEQNLVVKALLDGRIVGSVRAYERDGTCYVGRLIVHPDCQNRGIGTALMHEIEQRFAGASRYELFTGERSERNLHLYRKLGYRVFRSERMSDVLTLVYLEKLNVQSPLPAAGPS